MRKCRGHIGNKGLCDLRQSRRAKKQSKKQEGGQRERNELTCRDGQLLIKVTLERMIKDELHNAPTGITRLTLF